MPSEDKNYLPHAYGDPAVSGVIRHQPEDFVVEETLSFELTGQGEHVYLFIEKRDCNTMWLVKQIARLANVITRDVGYAGLKDKRAITRQWFSIYFPKGEEPNWSAIESEEVRLLQQTRHQAKLRRGAIAANHFELTIRELAGEIDDLPERLQTVTQQGVPNYFTEQRFGRDHGNIQLAIDLFAGKIKMRDRQKQGLLYSAARSCLFNQILAERIQKKIWNKAWSGDVMMLAGSKRFFTTENEDLSELQQRLDEFDIHPSGVLWGKGELDTSDQVKELELAIIDSNPELKQGLVKAGVKQARRSLRLMPRDLRWQIADDKQTLQLQFNLESGGYATAVLRELLNYRQVFLQA